MHAEVFAFLSLLHLFALFGSGKQWRNAGVYLLLELELAPYLWVALPSPAPHTSLFGNGHD
jgi:hypothetical protein